jgi:hypothetical protein
MNDHVQREKLRDSRRREEVEIVVRRRVKRRRPFLLERRSKFPIQ